MHFSRFFASSLSLVACTCMLAGCGEDKTPASAAVPAAANAHKVGIVQLVEHPALDAANRGIVDALAKRGVAVTIDQQNAQADQSNLANIASRFLNHKTELIFAIATPAAQVMANATDTTPIVATAVTDFEIAKLVKSNNKPGTNVTGSSDMNPVAAQLDLIMRIVPAA
ncbi:MAG: ABC transporter substrate binding protein, partial [Duodenibacillus sp.]